MAEHELPPHLSEQDRRVMELFVKHGFSMKALQAAHPEISLGEIMRVATMMLIALDQEAADEDEPPKPEGETEGERKERQKRRRLPDQDRAGGEQAADLEAGGGAGGDQAGSSARSDPEVDGVVQLSPACIYDR